MKRTPSSILALLLAVCLVLPANADTSPEYKLKALVLFNFAKFVDWPPQAFPNTTKPIVIGVLGEDPFNGVLDEIVRGRTINGRSLTIKRSERVEDLKDCHVLFISASEKSRHPQILANLSGSNVLTVSDTDGFLAHGGMVRFLMVDKKLRFASNVAAAEHAGLKIQ